MEKSRKIDGFPPPSYQFFTKHFPKRLFYWRIILRKLFPWHFPAICSEKHLKNQLSTRLKLHWHHAGIKAIIIELEVKHSSQLMENIPISWKIFVISIPAIQITEKINGHFTKMTTNHHMRSLNLQLLCFQFKSSFSESAFSPQKLIPVLNVLWFFCSFLKHYPVQFTLSPVSPINYLSWETCKLKSRDGECSISHSI